jgi:hypothetical protein
MNPFAPLVAIRKKTVSGFSAHIRAKRERADITARWRRMVRVFLPDLLSQLVGRRCYEIDSPPTLMDALSSVFAQHRILTGCVLTNGGWLRDGVAIYIDREEVRDRVRLSDPLGTDSEIRIARRGWARGYIHDEVPCMPLSVRKRAAANS